MSSVIRGCRCLLCTLGIGNISATSGVLGNGGANADGIAVFDVPVNSITSSTVPVDAVFFGDIKGIVV